MLEESSLQSNKAYLYHNKNHFMKKHSFMCDRLSKAFPLSTTAVPLILFIIRFMHCFQQCDFCDTVGPRITRVLELQKNRVT